MNELAGDILREARRVPPLLVRTVPRLLLRPFLRRPESGHDIDVYIHSDAFGPPIMYDYWRYRLERDLSFSPTVFLPQMFMRSYKQLETYLDRMDAVIRKRPGWHKRIHIGLGFGGFPGLVDLRDHQDKVLLVILVATPVHTEHLQTELHPQIRRFLDIDVGKLPDLFVRLRCVFNNPSLLKNMGTISSNNDTLFPPKACIINGARNIILEKPRHVDFVDCDEAIDVTEERISMVLPEVNPDHHIARRQAVAIGA